MEEIKEIKFVNFNNSFLDELNSWEEIEKSQGKSRLKDYVILFDFSLGEFLQYLQEELSVSTKIVLDGENVVGFVCYDKKDETHTHIEYVGVNPNFRKQGYSKTILLTLKEKLKSKYPNMKFTLSVHKQNQAGINSFSKFTTKGKDTTDNYIGLEL